MSIKKEKAWADYKRGRMLEQGECGPVDMQAAARLYRAAALRGLADAQHALAFLYATGQGLRHDDAMAVAWFTAAAQQDHCAAQHNLGVMYAEGRGVETDEQAAVHWFYRAALNGNEVSRDWIATTRSQLRSELAD